SRLGVGYELSDVLLEYSVLRTCIVEGITLERDLAVGERVSLHKAIDKMAARSVQRFAQARDKVIASLDRISSEALSSGSVDDLLQRLLNALLEASPAVASVTILLKHDDGRLHVRAAVGLTAERDPNFSIAFGEGFAGTIAATGAPMLLHSAATDPLVSSEFL